MAQLRVEALHHLAARLLHLGRGYLVHLEVVRAARVGMRVVFLLPAAAGLARSRLAALAGDSRDECAAQTEAMAFALAPADTASVLVFTAAALTRRLRRLDRRKGERHRGKSEAVEGGTDECIER